MVLFFYIKSIMTSKYGTNFFIIIIIILNYAIEISNISNAENILIKRQLPWKICENYIK